MFEFVLVFTSYGNFGRNYDHVRTVRARTEELAIRRIERANPEWYYRGCTGSWPV